ncbi:hypothetical protein [Photobacterium phosphoreum]|uniref:hypothetical protein n=1 Tax=Photobacterium phosphoreum TaxID=659 RepID=UPI000D167D0E|nr:hypothetical protein [Photobacterium phosphoreum]PTB31816.1 hypothetical protein DAT36_15120 [Photobacterium phosphoreum]
MKAINKIKAYIPLNIKIGMLKLSYFFCRFQYVKFEPQNIIISTDETLNAVLKNIKIKKSGAYIRFGDGDIFLINKKNKHRNQVIDSNISNEMKEVIMMKGDGIMKSLAIHSFKYGIEDKMSPGCHERGNWEADYFLSKTYKYFIGEKIYSPVALHYQLLNNKEKIIDFINEIKKTKPLFVGSEKNEINILKKVFNVDCFITTPHRNASVSYTHLTLPTNTRV